MNLICILSPVSLRLSSQLHLGLPSGLFHSGYYNQIFFMNFSSPSCEFMALFS
jgi:hypothetical protein